MPLFLLGQTELTSPTASVSFTGLSGDGDLIIKVAGTTSDGSGNSANLEVRLNGSLPTGKQALNSGSEQFGQYALAIGASAKDGSDLGAAEIQIQNFSSTNFRKTLSINGSGIRYSTFDSFSTQAFYHYNTTSAITSVEIRANGDNWDSDSIFSVYQKV